MKISLAALLTRQWHLSASNFRFFPRKAHVPHHQLDTLIEANLVILGWGSARQQKQGGDFPCVGSGAAATPHRMYEAGLQY